MRIADAVVEYLYKNGVRHSFGIPTSQVSGFTDALNDYDINYVVVKNEAAATYSAGRYADKIRDLGVCFLGGCVGVNNAINGIGDAYRNKLPLFIISSSVNRNVMGKNALQELRTTEVTKPITKYSKTVVNADEVMDEVKKALEIALTPPHGPVHISVPTDIQLLDFKGNIPEKLDRKSLLPKFDNDSLDDAIELINKVKTGLIMVGRGARGLTKEIKEISKKLGWPVITTPNAKGLINSSFKNYLGNYGWCTTDAAVNYVDNEELDCLLVLGTSLGQMSTRVYKETLTKGKKIIHIDWDKNEFNKIFDTDIPVFYDLRLAVRKINESVFRKDNRFVKTMVNKPYIKNHNGLSMRLFVEKIVNIVPSNTCFVQDMGENMNFAFRYMPLKDDMDFQVSLNYASMGTAVAGVMGSYLAEPDRPHAVIVGDGSFFMNGMEILTAKEYNMPIIYFVVNNSMFSLVEHGANLLYDRSPNGVCCFDRVSISDMAKNMGLESIKIDKLEKVDDLKERVSNLNKPLVVELITDGSEVCIDPDRLKVMTKKKAIHPIKEYKIG